MTTSQAPKKPRKSPTKERLLDAAERLFAIHGLAGVSLRDIGSEAGTANNYAVQYHFGDRASLLRAVFERRLSVLEARRSELLTKAEQSGQADDVKMLIKIIFHPLGEVGATAEGRNYTRFLLRMLRFESVSSIQPEVRRLSPISNAIIDRLVAILPFHNKLIIGFRLLVATIAYLETLRLWEESFGEKHYADYVSEATNIAIALMLSEVDHRLESVGGTGDGIM